MIRMYWVKQLLSLVFVGLGLFSVVECGAKRGYEMDIEEDSYRSNPSNGMEFYSLEAKKAKLDDNIDIRKDGAPASWIIKVIILTKYLDLHQGVRLEKNIKAQINKINLTGNALINILIEWRDYTDKHTNPTALGNQTKQSEAYNTIVFNDVKTQSNDTFILLINPPLGRLPDTDIEDRWIADDFLLNKITCGVFGCFSELHCYLTTDRSTDIMIDCGLVCFVHPASGIKRVYISILSFENAPASIHTRKRRTLAKDVAQPLDKLSLHVPNSHIGQLDIPEGFHVKDLEIWAINWAEALRRDFGYQTSSRPISATMGLQSLRVGCMINKSNIEIKVMINTDNLGKESFSVDVSLIPGKYEPPRLILIFQTIIKAIRAIRTTNIEDHIKHVYVNHIDQTQAFLALLEGD
ncbi:hypothetical protein NEHOM01_1909 [Nematocida homosporus]|uniref:uncharacterized protein n=1 Tax=Nematocida homosporus TaxID=1912981 RepID=UPI00221F5DEB|nr:uncharacterized protein NEHOM01_1909 [Nematocida homosporus]KAI5187070.1 hypothetical protein NEHOM01_1909 [Nematocida homosporus]